MPNGALMRFGSETKKPGRPRPSPHTRSGATLLRSINPAMANAIRSTVSSRVIPACGSLVDATTDPERCARLTVKVSALTATPNAYAACGAIESGRLGCPIAVIMTFSSPAISPSCNRRSVMRLTVGSARRVRRASSERDTGASRRMNPRICRSLSESDRNRSTADAGRAKLKAWGARSSTPESH